MPPRIISPGSRTANLGEVVPTERSTPFQSFSTNIDMFGGAEARSTAQTAQALGNITTEVDRLKAEIEKTRRYEETADLLAADRSMSTYVQDTEANYVASGSSKSSSLFTTRGSGGVLGRNANQQWFEGTMTEYDAKAQSVLAEYQNNLTPAGQAALAKSMAAKREAFRGKALTHWTTQARIAQNAELEAKTDILVNDVVNEMSNPRAGHSKLKQLMAHVENVAQLNGRGDLTTDSVKIVAQQQLDNSVTTTVTNILESGSPQAVAKAREWLDENDKIDLGGDKVIRMSANKKQDLVALIKKTEGGEEALSLGNAIYTEAHTEGHSQQQASDNLREEAARLGLTNQRTAEAIDQLNRRFSLSDSAQTAERARLSRSVLESVKRGENVSMSTMERLDPKERNIVQEEMNYQNTLKLYPNKDDARTDDQPALLKWMGMTDAELSRLSFDVVLKDYANKMTPTRRATLIDEWAKARGTVSSAAAKALITSNKALAKERGTASLRQVKLAAETIFPSTNEKDDRALFRLAIDREISERLEIAQATGKGRVLTTAEVDDIIKTMSLQLVGHDDGKTRQVSHLAAGHLHDDDGDDITKLNWTNAVNISFVPPKDRFELVRWYIQDQSVPVEKLEIDKIDAWYNRVRMARGAPLTIPPNDLLQMKRSRWWQTLSQNQKTDRRFLYTQWELATIRKRGGGR